jgi:hypothetical protein
MRTRSIVTYILVAVLLLSCRNKEERSAPAANMERLVSALSPGQLDALQKWTYSGQGNTWYKGSLEQVITTARYEERNDSQILTVRKPEAFIKDFQLDISIEQRLHGLTLVKSVDTCFFISEDVFIGPYRWTTLDCSSDTVFRQGDPFRFFQELTQFKDSLRVVKMERGPDGIIYFDLQEDWVLTYLPEGSTAPLGKELREALARGEMIGKNWNLRKLSSPRAER